MQTPGRQSLHSIVKREREREGKEKLKTWTLESGGGMKQKFIPIGKLSRYSAKQVKRKIPDLCEFAITRSMGRSK